MHLVRNYYSPLMSAIWTTPLGRQKLVELKQLSGCFEPSQLARVNAIGAGGQVAVDLRFEAGRDTVLVSGTLEGDLLVTCQRCLEPVRLQLDTGLRVALVDADGAAVAPKGYESVLCTDSGICLAELVEDEILLNVPLSVRHAPGDCGPLAGQLTDMDATVGHQEKVTPFAGLNQLLRRK